MPPKKKRMSNKAGLRGILRKAGLKATPTRLAILIVLRRSKNPLSAQEIIEKLGKGFDQTTVYRFMRKLKDIGIIRQIDLRQNHAHFEWFDLDDHHHLVCVHCGRIEDITGCGVEAMHKSILNTAKGFSEIRQHSLEFYGICKNCKKNIITPNQLETFQN
jgi:Fur family ferric uptake transcriptional regulator